VKRLKLKRQRREIDFSPLPFQSQSFLMRFTKNSLLRMISYLNFSIQHNFAVHFGVYEVRNYFLGINKGGYRLMKSIKNQFVRFSARYVSDFLLRSQAATFTVIKHTRRGRGQLRQAIADSRQRRRR
jgi:hypothetical protein